MARLKRLSTAEETLALHLRAAGIACEREYRWHPTRRFRADFALVAQRILIEAQGGIWTQGRHTRGAGYERDRARSNEAQALGWRVLEVTPAQVRDGSALAMIQRAISVSGAAA